MNSSLSTRLFAKTGHRLGSLWLFSIMGISISSLPASAKPANCNFTITSVNFGTVDLTANTTFDTTGTLSISCTGDNNATIRVCPNIGNGGGGSTTGDPRFMLSGANQLNFNLYQDTARTTVWGSYLDGFASTPPTIDVPLNGSGNGSANATIYGRVWAAQQTMPPGSYTSSFSGTANTRLSHQYVSAGTCAAIGSTNAKSAAFTVTATHSAVCRITSTTFDFGTSGVLSAQKTSTSTLTATCSATTPYAIALNGGNSGATDPTQRKMASGAQQITYGLYRNSGFTQPWGSTTGVNTQGGTGSGSGQGYTVYGRAPAQTTPSPGTYTDTIIVTTTY